MAEPAGQVGIPRLRAAWLREMGVEVLWPLAAGRARSSAVQVPSQSEPMSSAVALPDQGLTEAIETTSPAQPDPAPDGSRTATESAIKPATALPVATQGELRCRIYLNRESPAAGSLVVVADVAELHPVRKGPESFLDNMVRAVLPGAKPDTIAISAPGDDAPVGWLPDDDTFTSLDPGGLRVVLVGVAARRAAGMPTRIGDIGRMRIGEASVPGVALPPLNDLTASPVGKAGAWRSLRALMAAGD